MPPLLPQLPCLLHPPCCSAGRALGTAAAARLLQVRGAVSAAAVATPLPLAAPGLLPAALEGAAGPAAAGALPLHTAPAAQMQRAPRGPP